MWSSVKNDVTQATQNRAPSGIFGWLVLPAFITCVTPLALLGTEIYNFSSFQQLWALRSRVAVSSLALVGFEALINIILIASWFAVLYFMVTKSRNYPKLSAYVVLSTLVVAFFDISFSAIYFHEPPTNWQFVGILAMCGVSIGWYVYMRLSKRVKNTFVN